MASKKSSTQNQQQNQAVVEPKPSISEDVQKVSEYMQHGSVPPDFESWLGDMINYVAERTGYPKEFVKAVLFDVVEESPVLKAEFEAFRKTVQYIKDMPIDKFLKDMATARMVGILLKRLEKITEKEMEVYDAMIKYYERPEIDPELMKFILMMVALEKGVGDVKKLLLIKSFAKTLGYVDIAEAIDEFFRETLEVLTKYRQTLKIPETTQGE